MKKYFGFALLLIAFVTALIWGISYFIQPILPGEINKAGVLFFIVLVAVVGFLAAFKDIIELIQLFFGRPENNTSSLSTELRHIDSLTERIQENLHSDNKHLPYVLTLTSDLCQAINASQYQLWIEKELHGYQNHQEFPSAFTDNEDFQDWMEQWAKYRFLSSYVGIYAYMTDRKRYETNDFFYKEVMIAYPISEVVEEIRVAREAGVNKTTRPILTLGEDSFKEFEEFMRNHGMPIQLADDTVVYFKVSDFEKILTNVRRIILQLVDNSREYLRNVES